MDIIDKCLKKIFLMNRASCLKTEVYFILLCIEIKSKTMSMEICDDRVNNSIKNPTVSEEDKARILL